ncbi:MAG TPA: hypothetical protein VG817_08435, partial [Gemmatimonadales bacterium]|nr:hypothetical protein [Gemmatimonadales bacterium]
MARAPLVLLVLCLAGQSSARAQTSTVPLAHWQHTSWIGDRAPPLPVVSSVMRTPDGYLWVGSLQGLVRFDGECFTLIDSNSTPSLPSLPIGSYAPLLVDRTGRMWVSDEYRHLLSYADGEFRSEVQDTGYVHSMAEDG